MIFLKLPFSLIEILIAIIKAIFLEERTDKTGIEKEHDVLASVGSMVPVKSGWLDYLKYFSLLSGLIKVIIEYLNNNFGKDWGKENDSDNTRK